MPRSLPHQTDRDRVAARSSELAGSFDCAWFDPFLDLELSAGGTGLVARSDGHRVGEGKPSCPNQDGTNPYRNGASR